MSYGFSWKWNLADLEKPAQDAPTVFSTFACGGGSSMGYKRAGFNVLGCCEIDPKINAIYKENLKPKLSFVMDLRDFNKLEEYPEELRDLDILDGSPPCSTFSMAGSREDAWGKEKQFSEGQKLQRLDDLFFTFLDTVERLNPKVVVAENVDGMTKGNAKGYVSEVIDRFHELGYQVQLFRCNAKDADVPQYRTRIFFIANRMGYPKLKLDLHGDQILFGDVRQEHGDDWSEDSQMIEIAKNRRPGDRTIYDIKERMPGNSSGFTNVIWEDCNIAPTITASGSIMRMCDGLKPSKLDLLSVGSFPQDYAVPDGKAQFIVGMSVPPNLMANIAASIRDQWLRPKGN